MKDFWEKAGDVYICLVVLVVGLFIGLYVGELHGKKKMEKAAEVVMLKMEVEKSECQRKLDELMMIWFKEHGPCK